jgi:hypothetical protein
MAQWSNDSSGRSHTRSDRHALAEIEILTGGAVPALMAPPAVRRAVRVAAAADALLSVLSVGARWTAMATEPRMSKHLNVDSAECSECSDASDCCAVDGESG